jgi:hypothetical protein
VQGTVFLGPVGPLRPQSVPSQPVEYWAQTPETAFEILSMRGDVKDTPVLSPSIPTSGVQPFRFRSSFMDTCSFEAALEPRHLVVRRLVGTFYLGLEGPTLLSVLRGCIAYPRGLDGKSIGPRVS